MSRFNEFSKDYVEDRVFTKERVEQLLNAVKGYTLGQADCKHLIDAANRANPNKVKKGIAGDVIELSVLGCKKFDNKKKPDIVVDGIKTEVKTTGVISPAKVNDAQYVAKEPLTITAVSPKQIVGEDFADSAFFHKINHLIFVFYHYSLIGVAQNSLDYSEFPILGYIFWRVPQKELVILKNDWELVKDYSKQYSFLDNLARHNLKKNLMLMDYSSPKQPRFRFKRSFVNTIVDVFLNRERSLPLPTPIRNYSDIDVKLRDFRLKYKGKTVAEISKLLNLPIVNKKDACQNLIINMFGANARSINRIRDFMEIGLVAKTVVLDSNGMKTEDMKLFKVDYDEFFAPSIFFKDETLDSPDNTPENKYSEIYSYFAEHSFVFVVFKEPHKPKKGERIPLSECIFMGFKRYGFLDSFIDKEVYRCWQDSRDLVLKKTLVEVKSGGGYAPNFPKSKDHTVFLEEVDKMRPIESQG